MKTLAIRIVALLFAMTVTASADLDDYFDMNKKQRDEHRQAAEDFASRAASGEAWLDDRKRESQEPPAPDLLPSDLRHACEWCNPCVHPIELVNSIWAIEVKDDDWSWVDPDDLGGFKNMESFSKAVGSEDWADARQVAGYWYVLYRARNPRCQRSPIPKHECGMFEGYCYEHWVFGCTGKVSVETSSERTASSRSSASASGKADGEMGLGGGASGNVQVATGSEVTTACRYLTQGDWEFYWKRVDRVTLWTPCVCGIPAGYSPNGLPIPEQHSKSSDTGGDRVPIAAVAGAEVVATIEGLGGSSYDFEATGDRPMSVQLVGATTDYYVDEDKGGQPVAVADPGRKEPILVIPDYGKRVSVLGRLTDGGPTTFVIGFRTPKKSKKAVTPSFRGTTKAVPTGPNQGITPPVVLAGIKPRTGALPNVEFTVSDVKGKRSVAVFQPEVVVTDADGNREVGGRILVSDLDAWTRPGAKIQVTLTDPSTGGKVYEGTIGRDARFEDPGTGEDRSDPSTHRVQPRVTVEPAQVKPGMRVTVRAAVSAEDLQALEAAGYPRAILEIRITGPDGKEIARGPAPGPVLGTTRATKPGKYQVRAEIQIGRDAKAWRAALAENEDAARRLGVALKGIPGAEAYVHEILDKRNEALRMLGGVK